MATAATLPSAAAEQNESAEQDEDTTLRTSRKRKAASTATSRKRASQKTKRGRAKKAQPASAAHDDPHDDETAGGEGVDRLKRLQHDESLDTRKQAKVQFDQPTLVTGGTLRAYQLEGIRWLCNLFENGLNGILADEMGLGKTIQVIGLIAHLKSLGVRGPYLIVAPLSTLPNWESEFRKWTPSIPCVVYHGSRDVRREMRKQELNKAHRHDVDFPVIITSYEVIMQDRRLFDSAGFVWKYVIIDEGHRLKNMNCKLIRELKQCHSENRLLLTGTPLQNNLTELWSLLNFILPDVFDDLDLFESWFSFSQDTSTAPAPQDVLSGEKRAEIVSKLHEILRPFLLRRLKVDVVEEMPSKTEIFVYCPMAPMQREYYKMILDGTLRKAMEAKYGAYSALGFRTDNLRNRAMQLRKCCNHPYLFDEPTNADGSVTTDERIVEAAGKMVVLDKILRHLKRKNHKVLIFTQMTRILDILEDYLTMRSYSYCRLDGSTEMRSRQAQMEAFNRDATSESDSSIFCFLLSTRAGGLGINLIAADTVIFFDSDWNPQQDNQAQDRCHRIGQTREIVVYRLVTENSFENRMIARAIEKRKLERVVIQRGEFKQLGQTPSKQLTNEELEELMKDDIRIREGQESGGIEDDELERICNRQLVVKSFVTTNAQETSDCSSTVSSSSLLPRKSRGYEVVEFAQSTVMESFA